MQIASKEMGHAVAGRKRKAIGPHEKNEKAMREEKTAGPWLFGAGLEPLDSWCCQAKSLRKPGVLGLQKKSHVGPKRPRSMGLTPTKK